MRNRWLFFAALWISSLVEASRRPSLSAIAPPAPAENAGSEYDPAPALSFRISQSFFDEHAALVRHDLLIFEPDLTGLNPMLHGRAAAEPSHWSFVAVPRADDLLALARQRERVLLFHAQAPAGTSIGLALFLGATLASAHAPRPLRLLFDGPVHLGPAILDGSGLGIGIGGRFR